MTKDFKLILFHARTLGTDPLIATFCFAGRPCNVHRKVINHTNRTQPHRIPFVTEPSTAAVTRHVAANADISAITLLCSRTWYKNLYNDITNTTGSVPIILTLRRVRIILLPWKSNKCNIFWVCIWSLRHTPMPCAYTILSFVAFPTVLYFSTFSHKRVRVGTGGGQLWMRLWTFGHLKMQGISSITENRLTSQEGLCCME